MSDSVFTLDLAQNEGLGLSPGNSGAKVNASRPAGAGGSANFLIELEDNSGTVLLETASGSIELEIGP